MLWGCPGEPWTCYQLYSGRFFYCKIKRQERHYDRSHERSRPLHKFSPSEATGFQHQFGCPCYFWNSSISSFKRPWNSYSRVPNFKKRPNRRTGGGVVIYYKDSLDCISVEKYDNPDIEATWLEVKIRSQRLLVGCIYRPPDFGGFYDIFRPILERICVNRKNVIITGDFNANMLDNSGNGKKFKDLLQLAGFNNIIKSPTRVTENSSTVIDLICTNNQRRLFLRVLLTFASQITNSFIRHSSLSSHAIHPQILKM